MNLIIKNALALLEKDNDEVFKLKKKDVYIKGNRIYRVCECGADAADFEAEKVIDAEGKVLMPGLINAHTHAYMSLFRNYADDEAFWDWLAKVQEVELSLTEEDCYWGTLLSCMEMIKTGTTCFVDMNIRSAKGVTTGPKSACAGAAADAGMRAVMTRGVAGNTEENDSMRKFKEALEERELFKDNDRIISWFGPHAPYSCMADYLRLIVEQAKEVNAGQTIHLSESELEVENMIKENGKTPIAYVDDIGIFEIPTIAAHCVQATDDDIKIFKEKDVSVALNPKSNMKLGNGFAPAQKFLDAGVNVCLGTDGPGSNNTQNMFAEMNTAALVYKGATKSAQCISAEDVLRFATVNGARAIGREGELGTIKEGALADVILLDVHTPQFYPSTNLISGLVYSATGTEVETVIINGELVMEDRKILTINEDEVYAACEKACERLEMFKNE